MKQAADRSVIEQLQRQIQDLQAVRPATDEHAGALDLGPPEAAFPGGIFPRGVTHELISATAHDAASTNGFISVILGKLMARGGSCVWISARRSVFNRRIFPAALKTFGIAPERVLFVDAANDKEALWALEEALKCEALAGVVGEIGELGFNDSRRLQLTVERSGVTGLLHRHRPKTENAVTCVTRWKITSLPGDVPGKIPGVGYPAWRVQLLKVRHGRPAEWHVQWTPRGLEPLPETAAPQIVHLQTGS